MKREELSLNLSRLTLDPRGGPGTLERALQQESVHDRGEHADVVPRGAVDRTLVRLGGRCCCAAVVVPSADNDGDLDAGANRRRDVSGDRGEHGRIYSGACVSCEGLSGELEEDAAEGEKRGKESSILFWSEMVGVEKRKKQQPSSPENESACVPFLSLSLFLPFPTPFSNLSYPYLGLPSKDAMSSSSLAATMARDEVWKRGREAR